MEFVRRILRERIGVRSWPYRTGAKVLASSSVLRKEGFATHSLLARIRDGEAGSEPPIPVAFGNLLHPIFLRPGTLDVVTVIDNIVREEYGRGLPSEASGWMIDAGAYIGDTAAYFLSRYPGLKVIALEPNPESHAMAVRNLRPYGERAIVLRQGLWGADETLRYGGDSTGGSIRDEGLEIDCVSVPTLMDRFSIPFLRILKIDIEGAEESVFAARPEVWLRRVGLLLLEVHGPSAERVVAESLEANGFDTRKYRSVWCSEGRAS